MKTDLTLTGETMGYAVIVGIRINGVALTKNGRDHQQAEEATIGKT
jgi:hypothetical protein